MTEANDRPPMRPKDGRDDSRARAAARAAELRGHLGDELDEVFEGGDDFYINPSDIPDGWSYEWKVMTVYGAEDPAKETARARSGWEPVPASRHPSYMPEGYRGKTIDRKGMRLMERPMEITQQIRASLERAARRQVRDKEAQLGLAPDGQFARVDAQGRPNVKISKAYEPIPIPE